MIQPPLILGNWKMHKTHQQALALARGVLDGLEHARRVEVALAPPFTALSAVRDVIRGSPIRLAAQNTHWELEGAFTGEISPLMLRALGCTFVIVGHSERRRIFAESDRTVGTKMLAALRGGLAPILCVGETLYERNHGLTYRVLSRQLRAGLKGLDKSAIENFDIAYEPVWAIGTGRNATPDQVSEAHGWIRQKLQELCGERHAKQIRVLYGGSVRPDNADELAATKGVNGALIGGASLKAGDFLRIIGCFIRTRG